MFLVKVDKKTKEYAYTKIEKNNPIDLRMVNFGNHSFVSFNFDLYITDENQDELVERLEKDYNEVKIIWKIN